MKKKERSAVIDDIFKRVVGLNPTIVSVTGDRSSYDQHFLNDLEKNVLRLDGRFVKMDNKRPSTPYEEKLFRDSHAVYRLLADAGTLPLMTIGVYDRFVLIGSCFTKQNRLIFDPVMAQEAIVRMYREATQPTDSLT